MLFQQQPKFKTIFHTKIDFVSTEEEPEPELPIPETKAEAKEQQKYRYLPGERLAIQLAKQAKKERKKDKLNNGDIERLSASMRRVMEIVA